MTFDELEGKRVKILSMRCFLRERGGRQYYFTVSPTYVKDGHLEVNEEYEIFVKLVPIKKEEEENKK